MLQCNLLMPRDIQNVAPYLKMGIYGSASKNIPQPEVENAALRLIAYLVSGGAQCWVIHDPEASTIMAMGVTSVRAEQLSNIKQLHIFAFYAWEPMTYEGWKAFEAAIQRFAINNECRSIVATSTHPVIARRARELGAREETKFTLEV